MIVVFGYRHVTGVPLCPCRNPGNYLCMEQPGDDPLEVVVRCWCGRTNRCVFDSMEERAEFLATNGVT